MNQCPDTTGSPMARHPEATEWARFYRDFGWNPLPSSRMDNRLVPQIPCGGVRFGPYAEYRDGKPLPREWFDDWPARGIQLPCGPAWGLLVVDLDSEAARIVWRRWARSRGGVPRTWTVRSGGGGLHLYWSIARTAEPVPSRKLWGVWDPGAGRWRHHHFVELIGGPGLIVAPPSVHAKTGRVYEWLVGPADLERPAPVPEWVLAAPPIGTPRTVWTPKKAPRPATAPAAGGRRDWRGVLDTMGPDRIREAAGLAVRTVGTPNAKGWVLCHAYDREDRRPSAGINVNTGFYKDFAGSRPLILFQLLAEAGVYATWQEACDALGAGT